MLRLSDIMTKQVVVATPEMTLREVADLFAAHHISGAPVVSGMRVVGLVSAADVLEFAATERTVAPTSAVDEIMSRPLVALSPHDDVLAAANLMRQKVIHRVVLVDNGELAGIVTTLDIVRAVADHKLTTRTYVFDRTPSMRDGNLGQRRELES